MKKIILGLVVLSVLAAFSCQNGVITDQVVSDQIAKEGIPNNLPITHVLTTQEYNWVGWKRNEFPIEDKFSEVVGERIEVEGGYYGGNHPAPDIPSFAIDTNNQVYVMRPDWEGTAVFGGWDAVDIATGGAGKTYMVNTSGEVLEYNETMIAFESYGSIPGEVITRIDVEKNGNIWVVTQSGKIYGFNGTLYEMFDGSTGTAIDVGCGDGEIYAVITYPTGLNNTKLTKYNWTTGSFEDTGRIAKRVDVSRDGTVYMINSMYGVEGKRPGSSTWETVNTPAYMKYFSIGCCQYQDQ